MSFITAGPSPLLAPFVKQYWSMDELIPHGESCIQRIVPGGLSEMIFYFGETPVYSRDKRSQAGRVIISGQQTGYYELEVKGRMDLFSVQFKPEGVRALFNFHPGEIANTSIEADCIPDIEASMLCEALSEKGTFAARKEIVEAFLIKRLSVNYHHSFDRIADSVQTINLKRAIIGVDNLAGRACLSIRQYERFFTSTIGTSPIQFLRIVRFQSAIDYRRLNPNLPLTTIAIDSGYYDQSHMIADFRKLSGLTPGEFFAECEPVSDYFS